MAFAVREESTVRGEWIRPIRRPVPTYPPGRVCAAEGCQTVLSIYNGSEHCWVHQSVRFPRVRGKRVPKAA